MRLRNDYVPLLVQLIIEQIDTFTSLIEVTSKFITCMMHGLTRVNNTVLVHVSGYRILNRVVVLVGSRWRFLRILGLRSWSGLRRQLSLVALGSVQVFGFVRAVHIGGHI